MRPSVAEGSSLAARPSSAVRRGLGRCSVVVGRRRRERDRVEVGGGVLAVDLRLPLGGAAGGEAAADDQGGAVDRAHLHGHELHEVGVVLRSRASRAFEPVADLVGEHLAAAVFRQRAQRRSPGVDLRARRVGGSASVTTTGIFRRPYRSSRWSSRPKSAVAGPRSARRTINRTKTGSSAPLKRARSSAGASTASPVQRLVDAEAPQRTEGRQRPAAPRPATRRARHAHDRASYAVPCQGPVADRTEIGAGEDVIETLGEAAPAGSSD